MCKFLHKRKEGRNKLNIYEKILAFFNTKYIDTSYQIWIRKPLEENFNLAYKQGKEDIEKLPLTEINYEQSRLLYEGEIHIYHFPIWKIIR